MKSLGAALIILLAVGGCAFAQFNIPDEALVSGRASRGGGTVAGFNTTVTVSANAATMAARCTSVGCADITTLSSVPTSGTLAITTPAAAAMITGELPILSIPTSGGAPTTVTWTGGVGVTLKTAAPFDTGFGTTCNTSLPATGFTYYQMYWDGTNLVLQSCSTTSPSANLAVAQGGLGLSSGTSGGIPAFTGTTTIGSSGLLTANNPVIGGGAGVAPSSGTRAGNTTSFATTSGSLPNSHLAAFDANGNLVDGGTGGSGGGIGGSTANNPGASDLIFNAKNYAQMNVQYSSTNNTSGFTHGGAMSGGSATLTDVTDAPFTSVVCQGGTGCTGTHGNYLICVDKASASSNSLTGNKDQLCGTITSYTSTTTVGLSFTNASGGALSGVDFYWGADDTTAWTTMINAVISQGGGTIFMPNGCSALSGALTWPTAVPMNIVGSSARAYFGPPPNSNMNGSCLHWLTTGLSGAGIVFNGLAAAVLQAFQDRIVNVSLVAGIADDYSGGGHDGVDILNTYNVSFEHVNVEGWTTNGVLVDSGAIGSNFFSGSIFFDYFTAQRNGQDGVHLGGTTSDFVQNISFSHSGLEHNSRAGLYVDASFVSGTNPLTGLTINDECLLQDNNKRAANPGYDYQNAGAIQGESFTGNDIESFTNNTSPLLLGSTAGGFICGNSYVCHGSGCTLPSGSLYSGGPTLSGNAFCHTN